MYHVVMRELWRFWCLLCRIRSRMRRTEGAAVSWRCQPMAGFWSFWTVDQSRASGAVQAASDVGLSDGDVDHGFSRIAPGSLLNKASICVITFV